ncbi:hypothetical protein RND81_01G139900 [Saponaria officinalis]|uniref:Late embryogenesis abundant protein n=1 Tax=Saponaria officinalis TaxID=3572 RepID=A0AAW1N7I2_SAPOF
MARSLTHLPHLTKPTTTAAVLAASLRRRNQSTKPETAKTEEGEALRRLEEAVHRLIVKKAQPDWIPLVPGGSYWVPPKTTSRGFAQVVANLVKDSSSGGGNSRVGDQLLNSNRGWPSSAQFFIGGSHPPMEGEMTFKRSNKTEDEEG